VLEVVSLVKVFIEGAVPDGDRLDFERHLVWCSWCRDYVDQVRMTIELAGEPDDAEPPSPLREQLLDVFRDWKRTRE
jgi:hypothetical protein